MKDDHKYWLDDRRNISKIFWGLCVLCLGVFVADAFYEKHGEFEVEHYFGFYALFGFAAYVGLIFSAKALRKLLKRPEDYYD